MVIGPEIPMQYYTSTEMYSDKCMENQVCNNCTYRQNSISDVLSEDVIYFVFACKKTCFAFSLRDIPTIRGIMDRAQLHMSIT